MKTEAVGGGSEQRARRALQALELNRQAVRATFEAPAVPGEDTFPRSATFRWASRHLRPRRLLRTATAAVLGRIPLGRLLASLLSE